jgi:adenine-specific DNA-methyltransferase
LARLRQDERDYAVASAYSILIGDDKRKELSAYFTPPVLSEAVLQAAAGFLRGSNPTVLDPSCGGGAFITPIARFLISKRMSHGTVAATDVADVLKGINGIEIDPGLSALSQAILRSMLLRDFGYKHRGRLSVVRNADALTFDPGQKFDLVIGNPPYGKVFQKLSKKVLDQGGLASIGGHTNFYSLFIVRSLEWLKPGGGLVFVIPTSFVAGPYFSGLRREILSRSDVVSVDCMSNANAFSSARSKMFVFLPSGAMTRK